MALTPKQPTVSSIIEDLRSSKQDIEFVVTHQGMSSGTGRFYGPRELRIVKTYRFEEESNPSYSSILYVLETNDGLRGFSLDAYGAIGSDRDHEHGKFLRDIPQAEQQQ